MVGMVIMTALLRAGCDRHPVHIKRQSAHCPTSARCGFPDSQQEERQETHPAGTDPQGTVTPNAVVFGLNLSLPYSHSSVLLSISCQVLTWTPPTQVSIARKGHLTSLHHCDTKPCPVTCEGTCNGTCVGTCEVTCVGTCVGTCEGICEGT